MAKRSKKTTAGQTILGAILLVIIAVASRLFGINLPSSTPVDNSQGNNNNQSSNIPAGLPAASFKQTAKQISFHGCPGEGDGGDPVLNRNKNRVDDGNYQPVAFSTILNLAWPSETERKDHAQWS